jgi:deazaflavin-dependent oxidoreductase (nitroreductase family)
MSAFQIKDKTSQPASTMPRAELTRSGPVSPRGRTRGLAALRRVLRFVLHVVEMCAAMCVGAIGLSVLFFGGAAMVGYTNLPERAPVLTVVVVAINLSLPMAAWMRFRGMAWRSTLELSGATILAGVGLLVGYWSGAIAQDSLLPLQTGLLACPLMVAIMLLRFPLYSSEHTAHSTRHRHSRASTAGPLPRGFARFNRRVANPVIRTFAGSFGPFALVRHQGRRTGRTYTTPVLGFGTPDQLFVGVLYGANSDWVRNALESGNAEVRWHRESRDYRRVELIPRDQALPMFPAALRGGFRLLGVRNFVGLSDPSTTA